MKFQRGEVVLADVTYSDRAGSKRRPVAVVSADANNTALDDVILAVVTSSAFALDWRFEASAKRKQES